MNFDTQKQPYLHVNFYTCKQPLTFRKECPPSNPALYPSPVQLAGDEVIQSWVRWGSPAFRCSAGLISNRWHREGRVRTFGNTRRVIRIKRMAWSLSKQSLARLCSFAWAQVQYAWAVFESGFTIHVLDPTIESVTLITGSYLTLQTRESKRLLKHLLHFGRFGFSPYSVCVCSGTETTMLRGSQQQSVTNLKFVLFSNG